MEKVKHDIKFEKNIVDLLGYSLVGPDNSNRWIVLDENNQNVGFIQYKKYKVSNKTQNIHSVKSTYEKQFAYYTKIDSPTVKFEKERVVGRSDYTAHIYIKGDSKRDPYFVIDFDIVPRIWTNNKKYGYINFHIYNNELYLNTQNYEFTGNVVETKEGIVEERFIYSNTDSRLVYNMEKVVDNNQSFVQIFATNNNNYKKEKQINVTNSLWINKEEIDNSQTTVNGTIEEFLEKFQIPLNYFNQFKDYVGKVLPFKKNIVDLLITPEVIENNNLEFLFSKINEKTNADDSFQKHI